MANRGAATVKAGDPVYAIETTRQMGSPDKVTVFFKTFPSLAGFKLGLEAVKQDTLNGWSWRTTSYRTLVIENPQWTPCDEQGNRTEGASK